VRETKAKDVSVPAVPTYDNRHLPIKIFKSRFKVETVPVLVCTTANPIKL
jgi:hypothetical protein